MRVMDPKQLGQKRKHLDGAWWMLDVLGIWKAVSSRGPRRASSN